MSNGVCTGGDGSFAIYIKPDDAIVVTYLGYEKTRIPYKVLKPDENNIIEMKEDESIILTEEMP